MTATFQEPTCPKCMDLTGFLAALKSILSEMGPHQPLQQSMKALLKSLSDNLGYQRPFLAIVEPETGALKLNLTYSDRKAQAVTYAPGQGVVGQVLQSGASIVLPRMADHPAFLNKAFGRSKEELETLAFVCAPVLNPHAPDEVIGALSADIQPSGSPGSLEDLEIHRSFMEAVAAMVANHVARLQEEIALQRHLISQGLMTSAGGSPDAVPTPGGASGVGGLGGMRGAVAVSKAMRLVLGQVAQVGPSRATVLLRGESGTGKELLAEALHAASPRADKPLIKLNCAALPSELVESELFGHQKGAFTGAIQTKKGLFELAHEGTLFLDEIGELSLSAQAKVLRAIQEKEIQRLGSEQTISVDVRLITATHQPLEELLTEGAFREDLYYRINVFPIFIPPLRERREDILPLAEHFLNLFCQEYKKSVKRISTPAIDLLTQYHWPGNVRELRNCMERAVLICDEEVIRSYHLPPTLQTAESSSTDAHLSFGEYVAKFEQELLIDALKKARGNMLQAARDLRVSYRIVNYKVKKYGIDPKKFSMTRRRRSATAAAA